MKGPMNSNPFWFSALCFHMMFFLWISTSYCCNCCELYDVWWTGGSGFWWCICMAGSDVSTIGGCGGCCCGGSCRGSGWVACWSLFVKSSILKSFMCNRCSSLLIFTFRICTQEEWHTILWCANYTLLIHHNCTYGQFNLHWASNSALPVLSPGMQAEPVLFLLATILYLESLKMNHLRLGMIESEELFCIQEKKK